MNILFTSISARTVSSDYGWDIDIPNSSIVVNCLTGSNGELIGYSPTTHIRISADIVNPRPDSIAFKRTINFGDYYNSIDNIQIASASGTTLFCHNYIMPGEYKLTFSQTEFFALSGLYEDQSETPITYREGGVNFGERQPFSWMWYNFYCDETSDPRLEFFSSFEPKQEYLTWDDCVFQGKQPVTWEEISDKSIETRSKPVGWKWQTAKNESDDILNQRVKWGDVNKIGMLSRNWKNTESNKCLERIPLLSSTTIYYEKPFFVKVLEIPPTAYLESYEYSFILKGENSNNLFESVSSEGIIGDSLYFNSFASSGRLVEMLIKDETEQLRTKVTFQSSRIGTTFGYRLIGENTILSNTFREGTIFVNELSVNKRSAISPYTVRLSPRKIRAGSFPIEKLIWDFGDGSPKLIQNRKNLSVISPFVYNEEFPLDIADPRSYDVYHTYTRTSQNGNCFYPSVTAVSFSTGASDCASTIIGPLSPALFNSETTAILQSQLTENGVAYLSQVNGEVALLRRNN